jgi:hypothetical protein
VTAVASGKRAPGWFAFHHQNHFRAGW